MEQGKPQIEVWLEEGLGFYSQGDPARALEAWQRILDADPEHALAQQYVAYVRQVYHVEAAAEAAAPPTGADPPMAAQMSAEAPTTGALASTGAGVAAPPDLAAAPSSDAIAPGFAAPAVEPTEEAAPVATEPAAAATDAPVAGPLVASAPEGDAPEERAPEERAPAAEPPAPAAASALEAPVSADAAPHSSEAPRTDTVPVATGNEQRKSPVGHDATSSWMDLVDSAFDVAVPTPGAAPPPPSPVRTRHREENPWAPKKASESSKKIAPPAAAQTTRLGSIVDDNAPATAAPAADAPRAPGGDVASGFAAIPSTQPVAAPPSLAAVVDVAAAPPAGEARASSADDGPSLAAAVDVAHEPPPPPAPAPSVATSPDASAADAFAVDVPFSEPTMPLPPAPGPSQEETIALPPAPSEPAVVAPGPVPPLPTPAPPTLLHQPREEPDPWEVHAPPSAKAGPAQQAPAHPWGPKTPPPVDATFDPWSGDTAPPSGAASLWPNTTPQIDLPSTREVLLAQMGLPQTDPPAPSAAPTPPVEAASQAAPVVAIAAAPFTPRAATPPPKTSPSVAAPAEPAPAPSADVVPAWKRTAVEQIGAYRLSPGSASTTAAPSSAPAVGPAAASSAASSAPRPVTAPGVSMSAGGIEERVARAPLRFGSYEDTPVSAPPRAPTPAVQAAPPAPPSPSSPSAPSDGGAAAASPWDDADGPVLDLDVEVQSSPFEDLMKSSPPPAAAPAVVEPQKPVDENEELMRGARELFELGDFSGSLELVDKVLKKEPGHEGALAYLKRNEATLLKMYESKLGDLRRSPRQLMPPDEVIWINMHHKAGFILSQVDGALSYDDILEISGMPRFDTMRILHELVQQGVIG